MRFDNRKNRSILLETYHSLILPREINYTRTCTEIQHHKRTHVYGIVRCRDYRLRDLVARPLMLVVVVDRNNHSVYTYVHA